MKKYNTILILLCLSSQIITYCSEIKKDESTGLKIRGRGRPASFLEKREDSDPKKIRPVFTYQAPTPSTQSTTSAYNSLLEHRLKPSDSRYSSFSAEVDDLQRFWDTHHRRNLSSELRAAIGPKPLLLHVRHIFQPEVRKLEGRIHGFHHDPERALERSGLITVNHKKSYPDGSYKQQFSTKTDPAIASHKSLFPDSWSREETMRAILLALQTGKQLSPDNDNPNKEFVGIAQTRPPLEITFWMKIVGSRACITTVHPKH